MSMPLADIVGPNNVPIVKSSARKDTCSAQDGAPIGPDPIDDDLDKKNAIAPLRTPNWE